MLTITYKKSEARTVELKQCPNIILNLCSGLFDRTLANIATAN